MISRLHLLGQCYCIEGSLQCSKCALSLVKPHLRLGKAAVFLNGPDHVLREKSGSETVGYTGIQVSIYCWPAGVDGSAGRVGNVLEGDDLR